MRTGSVPLQGGCQALVHLGGGGGGTHTFFFRVLPAPTRQGS